MTKNECVFYCLGSFTCLFLSTSIFGTKKKRMTKCSATTLEIDREWPQSGSSSKSWSWASLHLFPWLLWIPYGWSEGSRRRWKVRPCPMRASGSFKRSSNLRTLVWRQFQKILQQPLFPSSFFIFWSRDSYFGFEIRKRVPWKMKFKCWRLWGVLYKGFLTWLML